MKENDDESSSESSEEKDEIKEEKKILNEDDDIEKNNKEINIKFDEENEENNLKNIINEPQKKNSSNFLNIYKDNKPDDLLCSLNMAIGSKNIDSIIFYFSKICNYINTNNLIASDYKKNYDLIVHKISRIKPIFEESNNDKVILNLILSCIKNNILSQIYLYVIICQIVFEKDNSKSEEIMDTINNLYNSLLSSNDKYYLVIFYTSHYIIMNIKNILNYIDINASIEFTMNILKIMNKSYVNYYYSTKNQYMNQNSKNENQINFILDIDLHLLFSLFSSSLDVVNNDMTKMNKNLFREKIFDSLLDFVLNDIEGIIINLKVKNNYYNYRMLDYIINKIKSEYIIVVFDKLVNLCNNIIQKEENLLSLLDKLISKLYVFYCKNSEDKEILEEFNTYFLASFETFIEISKTHPIIEKENLSFFFNYCKNLLLLTIGSSEKKKKGTRIYYIDSIIKMLLNYLKKNKKYVYNDNDFFFFNETLQNLKTLNYSLFSFKSLMDITSYFPQDKRKIQYEAILDELLRSKIIIDNITKVYFSIALINNILEIYKNINNDNQTFTNIEGTRNNVQTIIKLNKLILLVENKDPNELLKLIVILGNIYDNITDSLKTLTSNSFYQILLNASQLAINYTISNKNILLEKKQYVDCSLLLNIYSFILDYMTNTFGNLFYDNKRIILECILQIDKINDQEIKKILANKAVKFAQTYIKIVRKEQIFEKEKQKEANNEYGLKEDNENNNIINKNEENQNENDYNKIKNLNLAYKSLSSEALLNHSLQNLVRTFIKTDVFKIKVEKISNEDDSDSDFEEEKEINNIITNQNKKDNNNKNKVFGYTILFDELNKIKGKRVESITVKLHLIDMYNHIGDTKKVNSIFLDIKEDISFLTHRKEYYNKVILVLDKIKWFLFNKKDALDKETIKIILKFIEDTYENKKLSENKKNEIKEKYKEIMNIINEEEAC